MRSTAYNQHCKERGQERDMEVEGDYGGFTATPPQHPVSCSSLVPSVVQGVGSLSGERAYRTENFVCATPATQRAASSAFSPFQVDWPSLEPPRFIWSGFSQKIAIFGALDAWIGAWNWQK